MPAYYFFMSMMYAIFPARLLLFAMTLSHLLHSICITPIMYSISVYTSKSRMWDIQCALEQYVNISIELFF